MVLSKILDYSLDLMDGVKNKRFQKIYNKIFCSVNGYKEPKTKGMQEVLDLVYKFKDKGSKKGVNGTIGVGDIPDPIFQGGTYINFLFKPLKGEDIKYLNTEIGIDVPQVYVDFLTNFSNGLEIMCSSFRLYGVWKDYFNNSVSPVDIIESNTYRKPNNAKENHFIIGGNYWDGTRLYIDTDTNIIHCCDIYDITSLKQWNSLEDLLISEIDRLYALYDKNGLNLFDNKICNLELTREELKEYKLTGNLKNKVYDYIPRLSRYNGGALIYLAPAEYLRMNKLSYHTTSKGNKNKISSTSENSTIPYSKELIDLIYNFKADGIEKSKNGTVLIGKAPNLAAFKWMNALYRGITDSEISDINNEINRINEINEAESDEDISIPQIYIEFLTKFSNGLDILSGTFSLYGLNNDVDDRDRDDVEPYDIILPNVNIFKPENAKNNHFIIGRNFLEETRYYVDSETNLIHCCHRDDITSLKQWNSLEEMLISELKRMYDLYDKDGNYIVK